MNRCGCGREARHKGSCVGATYKRFDDMRDALYRAVWVERKPFADVRRDLGLGLHHIAWVHRIALVEGDLPACRCGKRYAHGNRSCSTGNRVTPPCRKCGGKSKRAGRKPNRTGEYRQQRYRCLSCGCDFALGARPVQMWNERMEGRAYDMIWRDREKHSYVAEQLGVGQSTLEKWLRRMRQKYGPVPTCPCGRSGGHSGVCQRVREK